MTNPSVTLSQPQNPHNPFIGESFDLTLTFDNPGSATGYGPFATMFLNTTGFDGDGDGLTFNSANYLGAPLTPVLIPVGTDSTLEITVHGETYDVPVPAGFSPGDTLVVFELPFGSFVPGQPPANIDITLDISENADLNEDLNIEAQGGFIFGDTQTGANGEIIGTSTDIAVPPQLVTLQKHYLGPEDETATGPNFPRQYEVIVTIAPGQEITDFDITDYFPDTMQFVDVVSIVDKDGNPITASDESTPGTTIPGGQLTRRIPSAEGGNPDGRDVVMTVEFFIPRLDANGDVIIDAPDGNDIFDQNQSELGGQGGANNWDPLDGDDSEVTVSILPNVNDTSPDPVDPPGPEADGHTDTGLTGYGSDTEAANDGDHFTDPDHVLEEQSIACQLLIAEK